MKTLINEIERKDNKKTVRNQNTLVFVKNLVSTKKTL